MTKEGSLKPPYKPVSNTHEQSDPARVDVTRLDPFEHFCAACEAGTGFGFGGDFMSGQPGFRGYLKHRADVAKIWKRA